MPRRETLILAIDYVISRLTPRRYLWYLLKVNAGKHTCRRGELLVRIYYRIYIYIYIYEEGQEVLPSALWYSRMLSIRIAECRVAHVRMTVPARRGLDAGSMQDGSHTKDAYI